MKIHAFSFTCNRDMDLSVLMRTTLINHCKTLGRINSYNTDSPFDERYKKYGNGAGWEASMMKLGAIRTILNETGINDGDFILSVDSDVVFTSPEVFKYLDPLYGIIGIKHNPEFNTKLGKWSHMSGALIFIRGDIAKKMAALSEDELNYIRFQCFKPFNMTENEDVVLSYLASYVGARQFNIGDLGLSSGDFESDIENFEVRITRDEFGKIHSTSNVKSFYHLNYCPTQFLGEPVTGKWDIPNVLKRKGIEL